MNETGHTQLELLPLWWQQEFLDLQEKKLTVAGLQSGTTLPIFEEDEKAWVGFIGPYSAAFPIALEDVEANIESTWREIQEGRLSECTVRLPPYSHFPKIVENNLRALALLGFTTEYKDLNFSIDHNEFGDATFNRNRRRDLKKSRELEMEFVSCSPDVAIKVSERNRRAKNVQVSMSHEFANEFQTKLPSRISFHSVKLAGVDLAAAVVLRVSRQLDYVFMWGHDQGLENSGVALTRLAYDLALESKSRGIGILCLGTSSKHGVLDQGLADFKVSLGAYQEEKLTLKWTK